MKLYIYKNKKEYNDLSDDFNWVIVKNKIPIELIYNNYKTVKTYGQQKFNLNDVDTTFFKYSHLRDAITKYVNSENIQSNQLLFSGGDFTRQIQKTFKTLNKNISVNVLRHSFLTYVYNFKEISINQLKLIATAMGTSVLESLNYRRFTSDDEKNDFIQELNN
jgi:hypothetical protein